MSFGPRGYFEADGSYNERDRPPKPKPDTSFRLFFDRPVAPQLPMLTGAQIIIIEELVKAYKLMAHHGILPGQHGPRAEKKINLKIEQMIRRVSELPRPPQ